MLMRLFLVLVLGIAGFSNGAMAQQVSMGPVPDDVVGQFNAVGRVNQAGFKTKGSCSGTLIRPDVVLTAGHCTNRDRVSDSQKVFVAGWRRGEYLAARKVRENLRHPAYGVSGRHDPRFDVGLLVLDSPITEVDPLPLASDQSDSVGLVGYHKYIPHLLSGRLDCPVAFRRAQTIRIDCPVVSGNSGGPILERDSDGNWHVTAVVSSQVQQQAIATRIPQWIHDALAMLDRATDS